MYLISSESARLASEILRYISGNVWQSQSWRLSRNSVSPAVWEDGGWGDPSDRTAALPEFRYCPLPRACNTWSENTYQIPPESLKILTKMTILKFPQTAIWGKTLVN